MYDAIVVGARCAGADFEENLAYARFTPQPPQVMALRAALRDNPEAARELMLAREGLIDAAAFFAPENLQRLMAGVPAA